VAGENGRRPEGANAKNSRGNLSHGGRHLYPRKGKRRYCMRRHVTPCACEIAFPTRGAVLGIQATWLASVSNRLERQPAPSCPQLPAAAAPLPTQNELRAEKVTFRAAHQPRPGADLNTFEPRRPLGLRDTNTRLPRPAAVSVTRPGLSPNLRQQVPPAKLACLPISPAVPVLSGFTTRVTIRFPGLAAGPPPAALALHNPPRL